MSSNGINGVTDEMIMAYVDGELPPEESERIGRLIADDKELLRKEALFRETASVLGQAFETPLHEQVPERLLKVVRPGECVSLTEKIVSVLNVRQWLSPFPAAALALVVVLGLVVLLRSGGPQYVSSPDTSSLLASGEFSRILEKSVSGNAVQLGVGDGAAKIFPVCTFQDAAQRYCRRFELRKGGKKLAGQGVSCRLEDGTWELEVFISTVDQRDQSKIAKQGYELAGGEDRLGRLIETMRAGAPLGLEQERECIGRGWQGCGGY